MPPRRAGKSPAAAAPPETSQIPIDRQTLAASCRAILEGAKAHQDDDDRWIYDRCAAVLTMETHDLWSVGDARSRAEQIRAYRVDLGDDEKRTRRSLDMYRSILRGVQRDQLQGTHACMVGMYGISRLPCEELKPLAYAYARGQKVKARGLRKVCEATRQRYQRADDVQAASAYLQAELAKLGEPRRPDPAQELSAGPVERFAQRVARQAKQIVAAIAAGRLKLSGDDHAVLAGVVAAARAMDDLHQALPVVMPAAAPAPAPAPVDEQETEARWIEGVVQAVVSQLGADERRELQRWLTLTLAGKAVQPLVRLVRSACDRLEAAAAAPTLIEAINDWIDLIVNPSYEAGWVHIYNFFIVAQLPGFLDHLHALKGADLDRDRRALLEQAWAAWPRSYPAEATPERVLTQEISAYFESHGGAAVSAKGAQLFWEAARPLIDDLDALERRLVAALGEDG